MKTSLLILLAAMGWTSDAFAQGQVTLANNATSLIYLFNPEIPAPPGSLNIQLYAAAGTDQAQGSLTPIGPIVGIIPFVSGRIQSTIIDVPQAPNGQICTFLIWAWSTPFATLEEAIAAGGLVGASTLFTSATSFQVPGDPPPLPVSLAGKYPGFGPIPIPEPSTMALSAIAVSTLWVFRRKK